VRPLTLLLSSLALALGTLVAAPAAPASAAACSGTSGVTVVIDSTAYCAPGDPASGLAALQAVASVVQVQTQPGFVCRINGAPASDPCVRTPPATAYWSYWHAQPGGSWQYSNLGAASYDPAPGSVEGWSFGSGGRPGIAPPSAPTQQPSPAQPDPPPASTAPPAQPAPPAGGGSGTVAPAPGSSATSGGTSGGSTGTTGTTSGGTPAPGATTGATAPTGTASGAPATTAPSTSGAPASEGATTTSSAEPSPSGTREAVALVSGTRDAGGPPWTAIGGGMLVVALGAAAGVVAWRRRAADAGPGAYGG
jgi:hypothetical protein